MINSRIVCVVDDDDVCRLRVRFLLEAQGLRVRDYSSPKQFLLDGNHDAACVVMELRMPEMAGLGIQEEIACRMAGLPVVILASRCDVQHAVRAMKAGAWDFLSKPFADEALMASVLRAVESSRDGRMRAEEAKAAAALLTSLTDRERQVFDQLVTGRRNKMVAHDLGISPRTVEVYRARIMQKLHGNKIADLVRVAVAAGQ
jgi:two-component system, LuxR family, response regulator FixJ